MTLTNEDLLALSDMMDKKLEPMEADIQEMKADIQGLKADMQEAKADIQGLKADMQETKAEIQELKADMQETKVEIQGLKTKIQKMDNNISGIELHLENTTDRNINFIAEGHLDLNRKLDKALEVEHEKELLLIRVNYLESEVRRIKSRLAEIS